MLYIITLIAPGCGNFQLQRTVRAARFMHSMIRAWFTHHDLFRNYWQNYR